MALLAKATLILTLVSGKGITVTNYSTDSVLQCREHMQGYVKDFPGAEIVKQTTNAINAMRAGDGFAGTTRVEIYLRCQEH